MVRIFGADQGAVRALRRTHEQLPPPQPVQVRYLLLTRMLSPLS